ncbi:MAG: hypothetical protein JNL74_09735 [Fibrobacteres bacterium]|nr:hypothetical protein [Fibrobacterota bacterium]
MRYFTVFLIITAAVILHSAGSTNLYSLEAKRKLLKSSIKEYQAEADSIRTIILQSELSDNEHSIEWEADPNPKRRHTSTANRNHKAANSPKSSLIASLDSLDLLIKKYAEEDRAISDTIKAYLKGTQ